MKRLNLLKAQLPKRCPKARLGRPGGLFIVLLGFEPGLQLLGGGPVVPLLVTAPSPTTRKDVTPLNRKPGGLMEQSNASLQRGDQG